MNDTIQLTFSDIQPEQQELLIAHLSEAGFDGFEQNDHELKAFIDTTAYDATLVKSISEKYNLRFTETTIAAQNWNAVWESNFQPVVVDDFVAVRASFHEPVKGVEQEIVITPKMSFGTGHHATTFMMMQEMRKIDFSDKTVFDFGTGTGVLAILAEKLGAAEVLAVDIDEWSIENAKENLERNGCRRVRISQADSANMGRSFDVILANINKNVILDNMQTLAGQLKPGAVILFSGLLKEDQADIENAASGCGLDLNNSLQKDNWLCMRMLKMR